MSQNIEIKVEKLPDKFNLISKIYDKYCNVFGIHIFGTKKTPSDKVLWAGNILAEYLDNDRDGKVDNSLILENMLSNNAALIMAYDEEDEESSINYLQNLFNIDDDSGTHYEEDSGTDYEEDSGTDYEYEEGFNSYVLNNESNIQIMEIIKNSQMVYAIETGNNLKYSFGEPRFDASLEEILHLITDKGYSTAYPDIFGPNKGTKIANLMDKARGGYFKNVPDKYPDSAWYTYEDDSCEYDCQITEYLYWGIITILKPEWKDRSMDLNKEWKIRKSDGSLMTLGERDPEFFELLTNEKYKFPKILPTGNYTINSINSESYQQKILLKKGWNLRSFMFNFDFKLVYDNKNILEIKNENKSYNSTVPEEFNNLNMIELDKGYYIKCVKDTTLIIEGKYTDKITYKLNKGWNLVGYPYDLEYKLEDLNSNIKIIKSEFTSFMNKSTNLPSIFNTLNSLDNTSAYHIFCEEQVNLVIKNNNIIEDYDIVIIGAGPAGCMISKILSENENYKNKKIVLLEKGSFHIKNEFDKKYRNLLEWSNAMNDSNNSNTFLTNNEKLVWLGEGLGGGTLHFGMQYIDQKELYDDIPKVQLYLDKVNEITKTEGFDYTKNNNKLWKELHDKFKNDPNINFYNNKIYSDNIESLHRFVASDLLEGINIDIKTNANVKEIIFENNTAKEIILENNKVIRFNKLILSAGAISNVEILHKSSNENLSKLPIGETIFDHAGVNFYYQPNETFPNYIDIGHLQVRSKDLKTQVYFSKVPNVNLLIVTLAQAKKESNSGNFDYNKNEFVINHFTDLDKADSMLELYEYINKKLNEIGYFNTDPTKLDANILKLRSDSIYHYHGTCPKGKVVDKNSKIIGIDNIYIGDISILNNCVPGSTSVASMTLGYRLAKSFDNENFLDIENEIIELKNNISILEKEKETLFSENKLRDLWKNENKMYVVIQNNGSRIGQGKKIVYDMGNFWKGGGHPVNLTSYLESEKYNFTNLLKNRHGSFSGWRISRGGAEEVGYFDDGSIDEEIKTNQNKISELLKLIT